jgi:hypothetical protein
VEIKTQKLALMRNALGVAFNNQKIEKMIGCCGLI